MAKDTKETKETLSDKAAISDKAPAGRKLRKVESIFADAWKPEEPGESIAGQYIGPQAAKGGKKGDFLAYHIKLDDGRRVSVTGASLATIMPQIPRGSFVQVTFRGMVEMKAGDMKVFDVEIFDDVELIDPMDEHREE